MKSYTTLRNLYGSLTNDTGNTNLTLGDQLMNDDYRAIVSVKDWAFLERLRILKTKAATQFINLPYDCDQVRSVSVIFGSTTYTPRLSPSKAHWDKLNYSTYTSDVPEWYFVYSGQLGLWPTPITAGNTINVNQKSRVIDLSVADYATGTIVSTVTTAGVTTVTGDSTVWTAQMVGRYIRITYIDTANTGDGLWYEIAGVTSNTIMTLVRAYGGTAITAGTAAYTIGQMPLLPEAYHDMPPLHAAGLYWSKENDNRGPAFLAQHGSFGDGGGLPTGRIADLVKNWSSPTTSFVIDDGERENTINPNLVISL